MKVLWWSNAPWAGTGYGVQTSQVVRRLKATGQEIAISANFGLFGTSLEWEGIPVRPQGKDHHSTDQLAPNLHWWLKDEPGWLVTLYDVWVIRVPIPDFARVASWIPIDHSPVPPEVLPWAKTHHMIAMSRFGQQQLAEAGVKSWYVPHAIETSIFRPVTSEIYRKMEVPEGAFVVMVNAANKGGSPPRKAWNEMLTAFKLFADRHEDAYLYLHTDMEGLAGAPNLYALLDLLGMLRRHPDGRMSSDRVRWAPQTPLFTGDIAQSTLAELYSGADVLLATSMGEGFGVPVIEAQACGLPVIVTNFSAQPELVGAGWRVPFQPYYDHLQRAMLALPSIAGILEGLEQAYAARGDAALREKALAFAQGYDADWVFEQHWRPVLAEMEDLLKPPSRQARRSATRRQRKARK